MRRVNYTTQFKKEIMLISKRGYNMVIYKINRQDLYFTRTGTHSDLF